jgi:hypothetical protein
MNIDKELTTELLKLQQDRMVIREELDNNKKQLIEDLNNGLGDEIKTGFSDLNKPIRYRKSLRLRLKLFLKRINKVLGN